MSKKASQISMVFAVALFAVLLMSCGGASNNDQGMGFTLFGFYKDAGETGDAGQLAPLSSDPESASGAYHGLTTFFALQNNLLHQGIRVQRTILRYYVEGASVQPPSTTQPMGVILGPASSGGSTTKEGPLVRAEEGGGSSAAGGGVVKPPDGSLPPGWESIANVQYAESYIVPAEIMAWLNLNRQYLPELPFTMTVTASVVGITTAGDQLVTNELNYMVQFTPDVIIPPSGGSSSSGEGGGTSQAAM